MFISKNRYCSLVSRIDATEKALSAIRNDETAVLFAFSEDIGEIREKIADLSEHAESMEKDREAEKKLVDGIMSINNYDVEVAYGAAKR